MISNGQVGSSGLLRRTAAVMGVWLPIAQFALSLITFLLFLLWLRLPDSSAVYLILSALLALLIVLVGCGGESALLLRLAAVPATRPRLLRGVLLLVVAAGLWFAVGGGLHRFAVHHYEYAGYLNSRFSRPLRPIFTYSFLLRLFDWGTALASWIVGGVLVSFVMALLSARPLPVLFRILRSGVWWTFLVAGSWLMLIVTGRLASWVPGHSLGAEIMSLGLRSLVVVLVDTLLLCFWLGLTGALAREAGSAEILLL